jgi:hypothetical protein
LGVWSNSIPINSKKSHTELNGPHYTELKTLNLNPGFEFQQLLLSLKHVINLVMRIRDTGCHSLAAKWALLHHVDKSWFKFETAISNAGLWTSPDVGTRWS